MFKKITKRLTLKHNNRSAQHSLAKKKQTKKASRCRETHWRRCDSHSGNRATAVLGSYGAWQYAKQQYKARRLYTPAFSGVVTNQHFKGKVHKVGEYLTFVTDGATYALNDPLLRIQSLYQSNKTPTDNQASHQTKLMDQVHCDDVTIVAELSEKDIMVI